jgi:hypothetical protein
METPYLNRFKQTNLPKANDKKAIIIALILGTLIIAAFFTQGAVSDYMEKNDAIAMTQEKLNVVNQDLAKLKEVEMNLKNPEISGNLKRYASEFREDDILENIFGNTSGVNIQNVTIDKGQKTPNGLSLANISLALSVSSKEQLVAFLDYLTSPTNTKRYIIKSMNYPYDPMNPAGSVTLELGMYYYEGK